ncbi:MAG: CRISPR-associated protein Cas4 [Chloroflexi bacterium]|nr:CRISPR-associated protein Cas4 [Chloroflexota bacterium]
MWWLQAGLLVALGIILLALYKTWRRAQRTQRLAGLPRGRIIYADGADWQRSPPLRAPAFCLVGKPDYVIRKGRDTIPIELKPGRRANEPYEADVLQLAAYCLLLEEATGKRPPYGLLRYRECTFRIPYTHRLRQTLLDILQEMRRDLSATSVPRSHQDPRRCAHCGYRAVCTASLVS